MEWLLSLEEKQRVYGIPRKEWPNAREENLFPCWKCKEWYPWFKYNHLTKGSYTDEVDFREGGHFKCCDICETQLCVKVIKKK